MEAPANADQEEADAIARRRRRSRRSHVGSIIVGVVFALLALNRMAPALVSIFVPHAESKEQSEKTGRTTSTDVIDRHVHPVIEHDLHVGDRLVEDRDIDEVMSTRRAIDIDL